MSAKDCFFDIPLGIQVNRLVKLDGYVDTYTGVYTERFSQEEAELRVCDLIHPSFLCLGALFMIPVIIVTVCLYNIWNEYDERCKRKERLSYLTKVTNYDPESARPDSPYLFANVPECQFSVWASDHLTQKRILIGHGYRDVIRGKSYLVAPTHVIGADLSQPSILIHRTENGIHIVKDEVLLRQFNWTEVAPDVSVAPMGDVKISGLGSASVGPYFGRLLVSVSSAMGSSNSSVGRLSEAGFGYFEYSGSTRPGFSGCVYRAEKQRVVAMHLGGGVANVAVACSYIRNLIFLAEDTPEALFRHLLRTVRSKDIEYASTGDPDRIQVKVRGTYLILERDSFEKAISDHEEWERNKYYDEDQHAFRTGVRGGGRRRGNPQDYGDVDYDHKRSSNDFAGTGYEDEANVPQSDSGNGQQGQVLPLSGTSLRKDVDTLQRMLEEFSEKVVSSQSQLTESMVSQIDHLTQLNDQYKSTQGSLQEQGKMLQSLTGLNAKLQSVFSSLETRLDMLTTQVESFSPPKGKPVLKGCLEESTGKEVPVLDYSPEASQTVKPSDSMDGNVQTTSRSASSKKRSKNGSASSLEWKMGRKQEMLTAMQNKLTLKRSSNMSPTRSQNAKAGGSG